MTLRIVLILAAVALAACGCGGAGEAGSAGGSERTSVVAAFYPLAYAAERIGGDGVDVVNLTPPGAEPHDVELSARDVGRVHDADVVFFLGGGFQPALERALATADVPAVDLLAEVELREAVGDDDDHDEHGAADPHVWLDPLRYAEIAKRIGAELAREEQAAAFVRELEALHEELEAGLADCARREIVTPHDAFGYLAERYDLEQTPIRGGLLPEAEATSRQLERAVAHVRARGVTTVFVEPLRSHDVGETVAREAGARTAVLDPAEGLSRDARDRGEDYFSVMRSNLEALQEALGCR